MSILSKNSVKRIQLWQFGCFVSLVICASGNLVGENLHKALIKDIKDGPSVFHSPEAKSYYAGRGEAYNFDAGADKDAALRSFKACVKLGDLGAAARDAIPTLIESFPKAVHISQIKSARYAGEGTFEDWVYTYVMSEKNKFMLSSPFLDYNSMSLCEQFIETTHLVSAADRNSAAKERDADITITLTLHMGVCALSRITGQDLGTDQNAWRQWWAVSGGNAALPSGPSPATSVQSPSLGSGSSFSEIVKGGKYRITLGTGDELVGVVEDKTDSSLIIETVEGKPYSFRPSLITRHELLSLPKSLEAKPDRAGGKGRIREAEILSFDEVKQRLSSLTMLEVSISNGSIFRGKPIAVEDDMIKLEIEGSVIPIAREVVKQISTVAQRIQASPSEKKPERAKPRVGPLDSIYVKNPQTDDYGNRKPDILFIGRISSEDGQSVTMKLLDGVQKKILRPDIVRFIKNSVDDYEEPIKRYAKSLFCSEDMFLADMPPGRPGRPFFKVCIDRYEYPNQSGVIPQTNVSYEEARKACESRGKRLCTADEWRWGCSGLEGYAYPYGWNVEKEKCNTDGARQAEPSGNRVNCVSKFGGYDMAGNVFEWVTGGKGEPAAMGGPYSKCQTVSPGMDGSPKPQTGFRCCKSN